MHAVHAVRIALHGERTISQVRQKYRGDAHEIVDDLPLGKSGFRIQHLVQVRKAELLSLDIDDLFGALGHCRILDATHCELVKYLLWHEFFQSHRNGRRPSRHPSIAVACDDKPLPVSSSAPPEFPPEQESLFREVLTLMNEREIPYAVSGAFALREHTGICRNTKDLDLFLAPEDVPKALAELRAEGFETEVKDPVWLAKAHRDDFFVDLITGMSNGVVTVDRRWIENATPSQILGIPVRVLAAEELLVSKIFIAFRERFDGADIVHLVYGTRGKLKWNRVLELVGEHWQLLLWALVLFNYVYPQDAKSVPVEVWDELLQRFRENLKSPGTPTNFRGSLLDERMFAIDVNEWGLDNLLEESRAQREPKIPEDAASKPAA